jgi:TatD DNase family protein
VIPLYDAHQHFHFDSLTPHRATLLAGLHSVGLKGAVVNATNEEEWPVVAALAREHRWILPSHGVHPWDCGNRSASWLDGLRAVLRSEPAAGVGEIGLDRWIIDGVRPDDPRIAGLRVAPLDEQVEVFRVQLALAAELNRAASIHCVQAFGALLETLKKSPRPARGFLIHGYGGPAEMVESFAALGAYFSFNVEALTRKGRGSRPDEPPAPDSSSGTIRPTRAEIWKSIPTDRLLVETDAPTKPPPAGLNRFPLPAAADGSEINHPANIAVAYEQLAALRGIPVSALAQQVETNFRSLFL